MSASFWRTPESILIFGLLALASAPASGAETYPTRPIRIIVPFAHGGGMDLTARVVAQPLSERLGQPVVIENRPGAGTMVGTELTKNAAPDGHTLMIASASHAINHPSVPVQNVKDLIAHAKANPGKLSYASSGTGATNHLAGELFKSSARVDMVHIPYKGGGPAMNDVIAGQVQLIFGTVLETMPQVRAGKLKGLAVSSGRRAAFAPDVKTISEDGLPGYDVTGWYAFIAPAAIPRPVLARLNKEITGILTSPVVRERLLSIGAEPWPTTPEQAQKFIGSEVERWGKLIRAARITAD